MGKCGLELSGLELSGLEQRSVELGGMEQRSVEQCRLELGGLELSGLERVGKGRNIMFNLFETVAGLLSQCATLIISSVTWNW
jgi:hypothetical protein